MQSNARGKTYVMGEGTLKRLKNIEEQSTQGIGLTQAFLDECVSKMDGESADMAEYYCEKMLNILNRIQGTIRKEMKV